MLWLLPGEKRFETRSWSTNHRGPLLVHAAKKRDGDVREYLGCRHFVERLAAHGLTPADLAFGAIIGRVELVSCWLTEFRPPELDSLEEKAGNWERGRYAWGRASQPVLFDKPIPYRGSQGFFDVPAEVIAGV
jgi:hypothetical protein